MSGIGKKESDVAFKASKTIDWNCMAKMIFTGEPRTEFSSLRRAVQQLNSTLQSVFTQESEPIDSGYYRKGLGYRIVDSCKEYYDSCEIPKFVDFTAPKYDELGHVLTIKVEGPLEAVVRSLGLKSEDGTNGWPILF